MLVHIVRRCEQRFTVAAGPFLRCKGCSFVDRFCAQLEVLIVACGFLPAADAFRLQLHSIPCSQIFAALALLASVQPCTCRAAATRGEQVRLLNNNG